MKKLTQFVTSNRFFVASCMVTLTLLLMAAMTARISSPQSFDKSFDTLFLIGAWTYAVLVGVLREIVVAQAIKESKNKKKEDSSDSSS